MSFINLGTRNKATFWEYHSAYSFLHTQLPDTAFDIPTFFGFGEGIANQHCHDTTVIDRYVKDVFWKELAAGVYTEDFFVRYRSAYTNGLDILERLLGEKDFSSCSNEDLIDLLDQSVQHSTTPIKPMLQGLFMMYIEKRFEEELMRVLTPEEQENAEYVQKIKALLLTIPRASIADREEVMLNALEQHFRDAYPNASSENLARFWGTAATRESLTNLTHAFGWFRMEYMHDPFTEEDYVKEIEKRITSEHQSVTNIVDVQEAQEQFFMTHGNDTSFRELVRVVQEFAFVLDHTKEIVVHAHWFMRPLFVEIAERLGITHQDLLFFVPPEIVAYLRDNTKADQHIIEERRRARAVLLKDGTITWYTGDEAVQLARVLLAEKEHDNGQLTEIRGITAYPGVFRGKAVVVRSIQDRDKFQKGDIFVTHDGSAEFNLFLQQAGAIVTNEGGMICHAAIVAREMKTPAVVGTRRATEIIKDGDVLEVDATRGIVRILS